MHFMFHKIPFTNLSVSSVQQIGSFPTENRFWLKPTVVTAGKLGMPEQERRQLDSNTALNALDDRYQLTTDFQLSMISFSTALHDSDVCCQWITGFNTSFK